LYAEALGDMMVRYEEKVRELSLLRCTSDALRDCTDLDEVFRRLLSLVLDEMATLACSLYLADESGELALRARVVAGGPVELFRPGHRGSIRIAPQAGPLGQTFSTGQPIVDLAVAEGTPGWFPPDSQVLLTAPLGPATGCLGVLALHERHAEHVPADADRLLPILAGQATIAIENAALYRRLKQHSDTLEARVQERTAALEHLNAELQAAAGQRAQFFAYFSHELRTPLSSILGFSDLLLAENPGPLTDRQRRFVGNVHGSGTRLLGLINDILDLVKVEAGRLTLRMEPLPVRSAADQALAVMQPQAAAKHIDLGQAIPPDLPWVQADAGRLHQILLNLLSNAVKFTPEGGNVTVTAGWEDSGHQSFVRVAVVDTGHGIPPEEQGRLFLDFEQLTSAKGRPAGSGLGLSLTRRLVMLHGGQVGVTSVPARGSTFWFTLPATAPNLAIGPGGAGAEAPAGENAPTAPLAAGGRT
jgi:signal transduction histidine kinase